ncbi:MAG: 3-phenylpropionate/trans-cinnamate dioxygenase ferredoxin reductase subunit [Hyphomicrobiaceae bacterium]|jgi:3-phenylpropionate/trans-cinnamate dioxygenase ferredoxin reductase subunit
MTKRTALKEIAIVGASLAGLRTAEALRAQGYDARITLIGDETSQPYDRPPLSKEVLSGKWEAERTLLRRDGLDDLGLDLRLGVGVQALDTAARRLVLADRSELSFDGLVIATGARARRLPNQPTLDGLFTLRTLDDAVAIRAAITAGSPRVAVIGAGFIGAEVAASCRGLELDVAMIEVADVPMARLLPREIGEVVASMHRDRGVDVRLGVGVDGFVGEDRVTGVRMQDGSIVHADVVVVGVGAIPATEWLAGSGLTIDDGVVCDDRCRAGDRIVAAGDCARWMSRRAGKTVRSEHWTNAVDQAVVAADALLNGDAAAHYDPIPYVWSDQYGVKIQIAGRPSADDAVHIVHGDPADLRFVALLSQGDRLTGCIGMRRARFVMEYLELLERDASLGEALEVAGTL